MPGLIVFLNNFRITMPVQSLAAIVALLVQGDMTFSIIYYNLMQLWANPSWLTQRQFLSVTLTHSTTICRLRYIPPVDFPAPPGDKPTISNK